MKAIDIIHAEHRALGAVVQALRFVLDSIRNGSAKPDFVLLDALIVYITDVPDKLHHPKEDEVLFVAMRRALPECEDLIQRLEYDHVQGAQGTLQLRAALKDYQAHAATPGLDAFNAFDTLATRYIDSTWKHIGLEERELLPLAVRKLSPADWAGIDAAFEANKDPWSGPTGEFRALFTRIVSMVPAPYGLGPALN
jgi:branched-chain amino acid transport system ATP-binding protein